MEIQELIAEQFQSLFEEELIAEIQSIGRYQKIDAGNLLIDLDETIQQIPLVISGSIKIMTENEEGNELLLYYLEFSDTCAMTLNCCLKDSKSNIRAWTESDCEIVFVPKEKMEEWLIKYRSWRAFVFDSYHTRLQEMLEAVDSLAFHNLEERLYKYLSDKVKVNGSATLKVTHQEIAADLNSSRVVISRLMKKLEREKQVILHRNAVELTEYLPS